MVKGTHWKKKRLKQDICFNNETDGKIKMRLILQLLNKWKWRSSVKDKWGDWTAWWLCNRLIKIWPVGELTIMTLKECNVCLQLAFLQTTSTWMIANWYICFATMYSHKGSIFFCKYAVNFCFKFSLDQINYCREVYKL